MFPQYQQGGGGNPYAHVADQYSSELHGLQQTQQQGMNQAAQTPASISTMFQQAYMQAKQRQMEEQQRQQEEMDRQATLQRQAAMDKYNFSREVNNNYGPGTSDALRQLGSSMGIPSDSSIYPKDQTTEFNTPDGGPNLTVDAAPGVGLPDGTVGDRPAMSIPMPQEVSASLTSPGVGTGRQEAIDKLLGKKKTDAALETQRLAAAKRSDAAARQYDLLAPAKRAELEARAKMELAKEGYTREQSENYDEMVKAKIGLMLASGNAAQSNATSHAATASAGVIESQNRNTNRDKATKLAESKPTPSAKDPLVGKKTGKKDGLYEMGGKKYRVSFGIITAAE